jgi:hypothetical protein
MPKINKDWGLNVQQKEAFTTSLRSPDRIKKKQMIRQDLATIRLAACSHREL